MTSSAAAAWTIEKFCEGQDEPSDWSNLHESSRAFLTALNLPSLHPFCNPETAPQPYQIPGVPSQGPFLANEHHDDLFETWYDVVITTASAVLPSLMAMAELWLRLFALLIAPIGIAHLLYDLLLMSRKRTSPITTTTTGEKVKIKQQQQQQQQQTFLSVVCLLTLASSIVLLTDTLYLLEFGQQYGFMLSILSSVLVIVTAFKYNLRTILVAKLCFVALLLYVFYDYETGQLHLSRNDPEHVDILEGLYYNENLPTNSLTHRIVDNWPVSERVYGFHDGHDATSWMPTGDARTGLPFLLNHVSLPQYTRVWLPVGESGEEEVVALDIAFPSSQGHDPSKPLYMVLHGLNGGSHEEYVKDFVHRRTSEGSTVAVFVARGLMDLPIRGWDVFHGARWTDAHAAATALRKGLADGQFLAGVGYSMGAIILGNYVARSAQNCSLDAAVSISGGLDMRYEEHFERAQRLWQPILTKELRETFMLGKWGERAYARLTREEMKSMLRAYHITEIDKTAVVAYHRFRDLDHYYSEMSALGDIGLEEHARATVDSASDASRGYRINNLSIPYCVVHAFDDPLVSWRTVAANEGLLHPENLTKLGNGNLFLLLTKRGGHVGWPLGWLPFQNNWKWMNDVARSFVDANLRAIEEGEVPRELSERSARATLRSALKSFAKLRNFAKKWLFDIVIVA